MVERAEIVANKHRASPNRLAPMGQHLLCGLRTGGVSSRAYSVHGYKVCPPAGPQRDRAHAGPVAHVPCTVYGYGAAPRDSLRSGLLAALGWPGLLRLHMEAEWPVGHPIARRSSFRISHFDDPHPPPPSHPDLRCHTSTSVKSTEPTTSYHPANLGRDHRQRIR